jgi:predicted DCC family thiol-disulfide oxidoreductase YuxK
MSTESPILVFDGVCVLCSRSVQFVLRHDREKRFRFATTQSETGRSLMLAHGFDPNQPSSVLLIENDAVFVESSAAVHVLRSFGGVWKILSGLIWIIPRPLRDAVYREIAKRRYRWFGKREICYLPQAEDRARFLD